MPSPAGGGVGGPSAAAVDVRDMLCAQALAVVDRAAKPLAIGARLLVRFSAPDVKQDLIVWARERGLGIQETDPETLELQRLR